MAASAEAGFGLDLATFLWIALRSFPRMPADAGLLRSRVGYQMAAQRPEKSERRR
jgi:hypothetical protein